MADVNQLNVLYIDDETTQATAFKEHWENILLRVYPRVNIELSSKYDKEQLEKNRPHLVIVDNVQSTGPFDERDNMGSFFIAENKNRFSDMVFILFTGQTFSIKTLGSVYPNPDLIIPKNSIKGLKYQTEFLVPAISRLLRRFPIGDITYPNHDDKNLTRDKMEELRSILEQSTKGLISVDSDPIDEVKLVKLTGGKSGALVFLASIVGMMRFQNVPCVFRFGEAKDIEAEVRNYNLFARLQMPHNMRVELLGYGMSGQFGGALYAFALGDPADTSTATKLLETSDKLQASTIIKEIASEIFGSKKLGWYNDVPGDNEKVDVFFANSEEYAPEKDTKRLARIQTYFTKNYGQSGFKLNSDKLIFEGIEVELPRTIVSKFSEALIRKTICHGDLNTNNIILSNDRRHMALIDFEYTGIDHIYKDFVSLEISSRCYFDDGVPGDLTALIERERLRFQRFAEGSYRASDDDDLIAIVRRRCIDRFQSLWDANCVAQYVLALSFHLQKVAALDGWSKSQFSRLISTFIAANKFLDGMSI